MRHERTNTNSAFYPFRGEVTHRPDCMSLGYLATTSVAQPRQRGRPDLFEGRSMRSKRPSDGLKRHDAG